MMHMVRRHETQRSTNYERMLILSFVFKLLFLLFRTAISRMGEATFEKVYDYYVKQRTRQRTDPNLDEAQITQGLKSIVNNNTNCFEVDQLVFFELMRE